MRTAAAAAAQWARRAWALCAQQQQQLQPIRRQMSQQIVDKLKHWAPRTNGMRHRVTVDRSNLWPGKPIKALTEALRSTGGRGAHGRISVWHRGGGHKKRMRLIDFKRQPDGLVGVIRRLEYDPNRNSRLALVDYKNAPITQSMIDCETEVYRGGLGKRRYTLEIDERLELPEAPSPDSVVATGTITRYHVAVDGLGPGHQIVSQDKAEVRSGNCMRLKNVPLNSRVCLIELTPGCGAKLARAAGQYATVVRKEDPHVLIELRSTEQRLVHGNCMATIGMVGNKLHKHVVLGKAGIKRHMGVRPTVRGVAMNPVDHPMGGGEGRSSGGRLSCSPWGKLAKGGRTRNNKRSESLIKRKRWRLKLDAYNAQSKKKRRGKASGSNKKKNQNRKKS